MYRKGVLPKWCLKISNRKILDRWATSPKRKAPEDVSKFMQVVIETHVDSPHEKEEEAKSENLHEDIEYLDDKIGFGTLEKETVINARKLGMKYLKEMQVYSKADRAKAQTLGSEGITTKWFDTNKGVRS